MSNTICAPQKPTEIKSLLVLSKVDKISGQQVVARDVPKLFSFKLGPNGERLDVTEIPHEEVKGQGKVQRRLS